MGRVVGSKRYFSKSDFKSGANRGGKPQGSCKQQVIQKITNSRLCKSYQQKTINNLFPWGYTSVTFCIIIVLDVINIVFGLKIFNPLCFLSQFLPHDLFSLHLMLVDLDVIKNCIYNIFNYCSLPEDKFGLLSPRQICYQNLFAIEGVKWHWQSSWPLPSDDNDNDHGSNDDNRNDNDDDNDDNHEEERVWIEGGKSWDGSHRGPQKHLWKTWDGWRAFLNNLKHFPRHKKDI